jgi:hypothetical protein
MFFNSYNDLFCFIQTEDKAIEYSISTNLLKFVRKCTCEAELKLEPDLRQKLGFRFRCSKSRKDCRLSFSLLHGTWFAASNLLIRDQILAIYCFALELNNFQLSGMLGISEVNTAVDWNAYFRDICTIYLLETNTGKIGGIGLKVEVDESKIFKNKNNNGRLLRAQETNEWVVGGICRETKETFFCIVPNRDQHTILTVLRENVHEGTHIISDMWRGYLNLSENGFIHSTVNHSQNFISPNDNEIHTQSIERCWRGAKENIPKSSSYESRGSYLQVYSFKRKTGWYDMNHGQRFNLLVMLISIYY